MVFRKPSYKCRLHSSEIASSHDRANIHAIGMQGREPAQAPPDFEDLFVLEEGHQKVLVITCQRDHWGWPFATCKSFDHTHRAKTSIHVIAEKNRHGMVEGRSFHIGRDA